MKQPRRLLVIDDDPSWSVLLDAWLNEIGYSIRAAETGAAGLAAAQAVVPDCVLLDFNLPDASAIEVCRWLRTARATRTVPIIVLSGPTKDKVASLEAGADYFVSKSENPAELIAVLTALFRRMSMDQGLLSVGDLSLDPKSRMIFLSDRPLGPLTPKMFDLLHHLVLSSPEPISREELFRRLGGSDHAELSRALDIMLNRLRKSVPEEVASRIKSVQGFGYLYLAPKS